jgi:hypothetical protein
MFGILAFIVLIVGIYFIGKVADMIWLFIFMPILFLNIFFPILQISQLDRESFPIEFISKLDGTAFDVALFLMGFPIFMLFAYASTMLRKM